MNRGQRTSSTKLINKAKKAPGQMGVFATRVPSRPNPILISTIVVGSIDDDKGII